MAKLLLDRENRLSISLIILPSPSGSDVGASAYVAALSAASSERLRYEFISGEDQQNAEPTRVDMHIDNQVAVLANPAIGGFVTHCGWNSTLESLWFGVQTLEWPLYAEKKFNAFEMVEELRLAVGIKKYWRGDIFDGVTEELVTAKEIERGIMCLMKQDSDVRKRVREMSEKCRMALMDGRSSHVALQKFIQDVTKNIVSLTPVRELENVNM